MEGENRGMNSRRGEKRKRGVRPNRGKKKANKSRKRGDMGGVGVQCRVIYLL